MDAEDSPLTDKERLLFGAGFVFGVMATLIVLAVVLVAVTSASGAALLASDVVVTIAGSVFFAGLVGVSLYLLAFPANRLEVPVGSLFPAKDPEDADDR